MSHAAFTRHEPGERLPRHRHCEGYVALVLAGTYVEAGDGARIAAAPGMVIVHHGHDAHRDEFGRGGARVLNLPLVAGLTGIGRATDPDAVVRLVARDPAAAAALLGETVLPEPARLDDWPDLLAEALSGDRELSLSDWAAAKGLAAPSLSRGFRLAYGVSPKRYRLEQRARRAIRQLPAWAGSLAALAAETGFADQAHLTRTVGAISGTTPQQLRVKSVQARVRAPA